MVNAILLSVLVLSIVVMVPSVYGGSDNLTVVDDILKLSYFDERGRVFLHPLENDSVNEGNIYLDHCELTEVYPTDLQPKLKVSLYSVLGLTITDIHKVTDDVFVEGFCVVTDDYENTRVSWFTLDISSELLDTPSESSGIGDRYIIEIAQNARDSSQACENFKNGCFVPDTLIVSVGDSILFSNTDSASHTFTSGAPTDVDSMGEVFDSSIVMAGNSYEWSPTEAGDQPYFCILHPWMRGLIIVQEVEEVENQTESESDTTQIMSDNTRVSIYPSVVSANEMMDFFIEFEGKEHVNLDIMVTQQGGEYMNNEGAYLYDGKGVFETEPLGSSYPVYIIVTFQGYGNVLVGERTGSIGERIIFENIDGID